MKIQGLVAFHHFYKLIRQKYHKGIISIQIDYDKTTKSP